MLVEHGEMGGDNGLFRRDGSMVRNRFLRRQFQHLGMLKNPQALGDGGGKFQGMKPGLPGETHSPRHRKRQRQVRHKLRAKTQTIQRGQLLLQLFSAVRAVDKGILLRKITIYSLAQGSVALQCRNIGLQIEPGFFRSESLNELVVDQTVLGGDFGRGAPRSSAADPAGFHKDAVHPGLGKLVRTQQTRYPSADDQHICRQVSI